MSIKKPRWWILKLWLFNHNSTKKEKKFHSWNFDASAHCACLGKDQPPRLIPAFWFDKNFLWTNLLDLWSPSRQLAVWSSWKISSCRIYFIISSTATLEIATRDWIKRKDGKCARTSGKIKLILDTKCSLLFGCLLI